MKTNALIGKGLPVNTIGDDGAYYVDTDSSLIYGPKTAGEWGQGVSFTDFDANTAEVPAEDVASDQAAELTPLQKLEAKIAALESDTDEVCKAANEAALAVLREERDKIIAAANTAAKEVQEVAKATEQKAESFWQRNKSDIQNYAEIALLVAIGGKILGVL